MSPSPIFTTKFRIMDKVELYRQVFTSFKDLCARGEQPCSFSSYCREHGVDQGYMRSVLKDEFQGIKTLPGYNNNAGTLCPKIYEDFKSLCAAGKQPGTFAGYYRKFGITYEQMRGYLNRNHLSVTGLPGFGGPNGKRLSPCREVSFEDVIFEEAGFLPVDNGNVITVRVDGDVSVTFPSGTDVTVVAKFIREMGKEVGHVGA